jgi:hypothetical protein
MNVSGRRTIHYTELGPAATNSQLTVEWNLYRREVGRLLAEGQQGRFVLIKGEEIIGVYDTWDDARDAGLDRFWPQPFMLHQILEWEPLLKSRGY